MQYLITFLEGVISFISPCMLPMLPLYISYFAGEAGRRHTLARAAAFVAGFTAVFTAMGLFAGTLGSFLLSAALRSQLSAAFNWIKRHYRVINLVSGGFLVVMGLLMALGLMNRFLSLFA